MGSTRRAIDSLELGMEHARKNDQLRHIMDINGHLSDIYQKLDDFDKAYHFLNEQMKTADSLYSAKVTRNMLQLETLYETEKRKERIHKLEQEKRITELSLAREKQFRYFLIGILALSLIIMVLFVFLYRSKNRTHQALAKSKEIADEANAAKDKFFSIIAHDLRSPFNGILGMTGILKDRYDDLDKKEKQKMIAALHDSLHKCYELLNNLLEWSRSQSGKIDFSPENLRFDSALQDVLGLLSNSAAQKNMKIINVAGSPTVYADRNMLDAILRNLISNAVKYSYPGGNIRISSEKKKDKIIISVSDSGTGIPASRKNRLFHITNTYRINGTSGESGNGLGLIICKEFVEKHGGSIGVESEPGKGSTFYFSLPAGNNTLEKDQK
ncbi:MAG: HAMP domain-containing sensor histidine kinase [Candidatus Marinimicrobia bacterium]|nr:HAMP domain-containing sensor histidine kinase [Candidatus Neomarinimicrobiota bacterium]